MGERKGVNKYYPPDWTPDQGNLNKYHGTHALRERARKLHEGILIIRFEMPYNIWCNGCGKHIGMGVRYNAQKRKIGNYYTTPIFKFRMKCHLCDQHFEIQTDPQNCDYKILSGARRKEERWDPESTENIQTTDRDVKQKLVDNAMFQLEHSIADQQTAKKKAPTLNRLEEIRDQWHDDFSINQLLRKKFRDEKHDIAEKKAIDNKLRIKSSLPEDFDLVEENPDDVDKAKRMRYGDKNLRPDHARIQRKRTIKQSSILSQGKPSNSKQDLAKRLLGLSHRSGKSTIDKTTASLGGFNTTTLSDLVRIKRIPDLHISDPNIICGNKNTESNVVEDNNKTSDFVTAKRISDLNSSDTAVISNENIPEVNIMKNYEEIDTNKPLVTLSSKELENSTIANNLVPFYSESSGSDQSDS